MAEKIMLGDQLVAELVQGPKGDVGPQGETGSTGQSAYQVAAQAGFIGSETKWLESLKAVVNRLFMSRRALASTVPLTYVESSSGIKAGDYILSMPDAQPNSRNVAGTSVWQVNGVSATELTLRPLGIMNRETRMLTNSEINFQSSPNWTASEVRFRKDGGRISAYFSLTYTGADGYLQRAGETNLLRIAHFYNVRPVSFEYFQMTFSSASSMPASIVPRVSNGSDSNLGSYAGVYILSPTEVTIPVGARLNFSLDFYTESSLGWTVPEDLA